MKILMFAILTMVSASSFAAENCNRTQTKFALDTAKAVNKDYAKCENFECAKIMSSEVQAWMCEATKSCTEIQDTLNYPCQQKVMLSETNYNASRLFKKLINKGLKQI